MWNMRLLPSQQLLGQRVQSSVKSSIMIPALGSMKKAADTVMKN